MGACLPYPDKAKPLIQTQRALVLPKTADLHLSSMSRFIFNNLLQNFGPQALPPVLWNAVELYFWNNSLQTNGIETISKITIFG